MKFKLFIITLLLGVQTFSQNKIKEADNPQPSVPNTIKNQFGKPYLNISDYKQYHMIEKLDFRAFKNRVLDSVKSLKTNINTKQNTINNQLTKIDSLNTQIKELNVELNEYKSIESTENNTRIILFGIIGALAIGLLIFIFKFRNSNSITKTVKNNLISLEEEFDEHRKNTLDREQKLRRKLQDEINKYRGV